MGKEKIANISVISLDTLGFIRIIAAITVMLGHTYWLIEQYAPEIYIKGILQSKIICSDLFFIISGMSLTKLYSNKIANNNISLGKFITFRLSKLYPLLLFFLPFCIYLFVGNGINLEPTRHILTLISPYFFLDAWLPEFYYSYVGPSWVISAFFICYIVFYYYCKHLQSFFKKHLTFMLVLIITFSILLSIWGSIYIESPVVEGVIHKNPIAKLPQFFMGVFLAYLAEINFKANKIQILGSLIVISTILGLAIADYKFSWRVIITPFIGIIIYSLATNPKLNLLFNNEKIKEYSNSSLPLFLLHWVILWGYALILRLYEGYQLTGLSDFNLFITTSYKIKDPVSPFWGYCIMLIISIYCSKILYLKYINPSSLYIRSYYNRRHPVVI